MASLSFDPFAHIYDATRGYPEDIAYQIAEAIDNEAEATAHTRYLEVGVGTGRIALPLASLGRSYTGVDISEKMLAQLESKLLSTGWQEQTEAWGALPDEDKDFSPPVMRFLSEKRQSRLRLVIADMTALPFTNAAFDAVVAVHVFHLVEGWQQAVREVQRVLHPGGVLLHCWDEQGKSDVQRLREEWTTILHELGGDDRRPGAPSQHAVTTLLHEWGLQTEQKCVLTWLQPVTPRLVLETILQRQWSSTWLIPDAIFTVAAHRLQEWAYDYYGEGIDTVRGQERSFIISKTRMQV
jgi:ubiquinone/menaquinone biosynthesis C-methylase UbiE